MRRGNSEFKDRLTSLESLLEWLANDDQETISAGASNCSSTVINGFQNILPEIENEITIIGGFKSIKGQSLLTFEMRELEILHLYPQFYIYSESTLSGYMYCFILSFLWKFNWGIRKGSRGFCTVFARDRYFLLEQIERSLLLAMIAVIDLAVEQHSSYWIHDYAEYLFTVCATTADRMR